MIGKRKKKSDLCDKEKLIAKRRRKFDREFKTIESGEAYLFAKFSEKKANRCIKCFNHEFVRCDDKRQIQCLSCRCKQSFATGTFLEGTRRSSTLEYLFLVTLLEEDFQINAREFERHSKVVYSTSADMFKKCAIVIDKSMDELENVLPMHCMEISKVVVRRSSETPAGKHPRAEQKPPLPAQRLAPETFSKEITMRDTGEVRTYVFPKGLEESFDGLSQDHLELFATIAETPCHFDDLVPPPGYGFLDLSLLESTLEVVGLVSSRQSFLQRNPETIPTSKVIGADLDERLKKDLLGYIWDGFGGVSQKASQLYLALHWFKNDRQFWTKGKLLDKLISYGKITSRDVRNYTSAQMLSVVDVDLPLPAAA